MSEQINNKVYNFKTKYKEGYFIEGLSKYKYG